MKKIINLTGGKKAAAGAAAEPFCSDCLAGGPPMGDRRGPPKGDRRGGPPVPARRVPKMLSFTHVVIVKACPAAAAPAAAAKKGFLWRQQQQRQQQQHWQQQQQRSVFSFALFLFGLAGCVSGGHRRYQPQ
ncbi:hypothetical protein ACSSS7_000315 [Eimeria intestinalis]